ncbi:MAG: hypothetical protein KKF62_07790 [Bacteroidetes bacterium]|nr:hypothetical protein [Bacteroidota bacterium]MBU1115952.1 hypothetical protein [Bacteroidota bacterium]MBU1798451.1 hypothetical protein [Bacteroidota bacterium]
MKATNLIKGMFVIGFTLILSTSLFAQEKPSTEKAKACCSDKAPKHVCTDECKTAGCDVVKAKEAKACADVAKHVCTDECKTAGCDVVKAKKAKACADVAKHVCTDECKTAGCTAVKMKEAKTIEKKAMMHKCDDNCKTNGCSMVKG